MEVERTMNNGRVSEVPQPDQEPLKNSATNLETSPQPAIPAAGGFDCNICLDFAVDPVVTLCGHLYCWPCMYKWLQIDKSSMQNCPVCKASLSEDSLVPLYGRGHSTKRAHQTFDIPRRPHHHREQTYIDNEENYNDSQPLPVNGHRHHHHYHVHHHYPYNNGTNSNEFISTPPSPYLGATGRALGGMAIAVLPQMFRNQQEHTNAQMVNPSPYYLNGFNGGSPRMRRQEMEAERSLHQIWLFLSWCTLLCLLLF